MNKYEIIFKSDLSFEDKINKASELALHEVDKIIHLNIKQAFKDECVWSEFNAEYKDKDDNWVSRIFFYYGDLSEFDNKDWRFSEVKDKRRYVKFVNLVLHKDKHFRLKQNHIKDYLKYLKKEEQ